MDLRQRNIKAVCFLIIIGFCSVNLSVFAAQPDDFLSHVIGLLDKYKWMMALILFFLGLVFYGFNISRGEKVKDKYQNKKQIKQWNKDENKYIQLLKEEISKNTFSGKNLADEDITLPLDDTFVHLDISMNHQEIYGRHQPELKAYPSEGDRNKTPQEILRLLNDKKRLLLIIGEPGAGKSTLMQYFAYQFVEGRHKKLGFQKKSLPFLYPLKELRFNSENKLKGVDGNSADLPAVLAEWIKEYYPQVTAAALHHWLENKNCLVLLDGLDEISDVIHRRKTCEWIDRMLNCYDKVFFVLTTRESGYLKKDAIQLKSLPFKCTICPFTLKQQREFLNKWYDAYFYNQLEDKEGDYPAKLSDQKNKALERTNALMEYLGKEENKSICKEVAIPVLLQIMAMINKSSVVNIHSRQELYEAALYHLLERRYIQKGLNPPLQEKQSRRVLNPLCMHMQLERQDAIDQDKVAEQIKIPLGDITDAVSVDDFLQDMVYTCGILVEYASSKYLFRHKTFREFLVADYICRNLLTDLPAKSQTKKKKAQYIDKLLELENIADNWWTEPFLFLMSLTDGKSFYEIWSRIFIKKLPEKIDTKQWDFLISALKEAPEKNAQSFEEVLCNKQSSLHDLKFAVECLGSIDSTNARDVLLKFCEKERGTKFYHQIPPAAHAELIALMQKAKEYLLSDLKYEKVKELQAGITKHSDQDDVTATDRFNHIIEYNAEYILISAGQYEDEKLGKQSVDAFYMAKYPVTNRQYRRFVRYLQGDEKELSKLLPIQQFKEKLWLFAETTKANEGKDFHQYLQGKEAGWHDIVKSGRDEDKKFNGDEQPVVTISWYDARSYCFWLSCLYIAQQGDIEKSAIDDLAGLYRLPEEKEWLWAAGKPDKGEKLRGYPWGDKPEPGEQIANYGEQIGSTTPVGRYPDGASIDGLMDMAGNVWEWQDNWYSDKQQNRALRGGCWGDYAEYLRCSARGDYYPDGRNDDFGFRVCVASPLLIL